MRGMLRWHGGRGETSDTPSQLQQALLVTTNLSCKLKMSVCMRVAHVTDCLQQLEAVRIRADPHQLTTTLQLFSRCGRRESQR